MRNFHFLFLGLTIAVAALIVTPACGGGDDDGSGGSGGTGGVGGAPPPPPVTPPTPPPPPPPIDIPPVYKRASLAPSYSLTPTVEFGRFDIANSQLVNGRIVRVAMNNNDFVTAATVTSAQSKLDEISTQINGERSASGINGALVDIISNPDDQIRSTQIPFRGNPSDVKFINIGGQKKIFAPLGGDIMTPGNEIAVFTVDNNVNIAQDRIRVGVRPQRIQVQADVQLVFVCNKYSNYISVVDAAQDEVLIGADGQPVEIATEFYCSDLLITDRNPAAPDADRQTLWVANEWRGSVLRYDINFVRDPIANLVTDITVVDANGAEVVGVSTPTAEVLGAGANPQRLELSENEREVFVFNSRGGEVARVDVRSSSVLSRVAFGAPVVDGVNIANSIFAGTTMDQRGLPQFTEQLPNQVRANPFSITGLDGASAVAHPGSLRDNTFGNNFEDIANGMYDINALLPANDTPIYFTDNNSPEAAFVDQQKILAGSLIRDVARNAAGTRIYVANSGSNSVQFIDVLAAGNFQLVDSGILLQTDLIPWALIPDEDANELYVVNWGSDTLQRFNLNNGTLLQTVNLGYAQPPYPATNIETGEYLFQNTNWSNDGKKSCASCHFDEFLADGIPYANGATAPTAYHKVIANFNQFSTDNYFWNGTFTNGSYKSLAFAAQTRTNCEVILFGLVEGLASNLARRVGDPANLVTDGNDAACIPEFANAGDLLPANFDEIAAVIANQKLVVADQVIQQATQNDLGIAINRDDASRFSDFYTLSEYRMPPSALSFLYETNQLGTAAAAKIDQGAQVFANALCTTCHDPGNFRNNFIDGLNHGAGRSWVSDFIFTYQADPRVLDLLEDALGERSITEQLIESNNRIGNLMADREPNVHLPTDFFRPFCPDAVNDNCFRFDDPLAVRGNFDAETERLEFLTQINLADIERGFVPGNVTGQASVNTPTLRGIWWQTNYMRHGLARSLGEALLAPGHPALREGETGYAVDRSGQFDVHGITSTINAADLEALGYYLDTLD